LRTQIIAIALANMAAICSSSFRLM